MSDPDVLAFVLAGGQGSRLDLLTANRAKPAVPFAGGYRLIDFPLSNCLHSRVSDVWVAQQYQPASLNDHLSNGRPWDLDRTSGGLLVLPPYQGDEREGWTKGTADGLWRNAELIRQIDPEVIVLVSADAVYRLDYRDVVAAHTDSGAVLTMVTTHVDIDDAGRYGVVQVDGDETGGRVREYSYKPDDPTSDLVTNEVFVFSTGPVLDLLERLADDAEKDGLGDLGDRLLPELVADGVVRSYAQPGYWRDVGTVDAYWRANMDFLSDKPPFDLDDPSWAVRTQGGLRSPAWVTDSASVRSSLLSSAAYVGGEVVHSVLAPRAVVEAGATVIDSILLPGCRVGAGARVERTVVDDDVVVGPDARIGGDDAITLLGLRVELDSGATVKAGSRVPDDDDDRDR